jgi:PAT family beta-lactamase induction signal transducer AmpG
VIMAYAPFFSFFKEYRGHAAILLLFIGVFRISDITMGVMANPFYLDLGFTKTQIASIAKVFGFFMAILGSALGGVLVVKVGIMSPLLITAILVVITNLLFSVLALMGPDLNWLALVIGADNLVGGMSNVVFIAFLSNLVNQNYTATQYALFSSIMTLPGKFAGGFSGMIVDALGYPVFFVYSACIGLPAILLILHFMRKKSLCIT